MPSGQPVLRDRRAGAVAQQFFEREPAVRVLSGDGEAGVQVEAIDVRLQRHAVIGARGIGIAEAVQARASPCDPLE